MFVSKKFVVNKSIKIEFKVWVMVYFKKMVKELSSVF